MNIRNNSSDAQINANVAETIVKVNKFGEKMRNVGLIVLGSGILALLIAMLAGFRF